MMLRLRIYTDTSVIGGCFDDEFEIASRELLNLFISGDATIILSELTLLELENAPSMVRSVLDEIPNSQKEYVELNDESRILASTYVDSGVIGYASQVDALHIAMATINKADVLVSWNFRHIVNLQRIHGYNSVNMRLGYPLLEIRSPQEVIGYEES